MSARMPSALQRERDARLQEIIHMVAERDGHLRSWGEDRHDIIGSALRRFEKEWSEQWAAWCLQRAARYSPLLVGALSETGPEFPPDPFQLAAVTLQRERDNFAYARAKARIDNDEARARHDAVAARLRELWPRLPVLGKVIVAAQLANLQLAQETREEVDPIEMLTSAELARYCESRLQEFAAHYVMPVSEAHVQSVYATLRDMLAVPAAETPDEDLDAGPWIGLDGQLIEPLALDVEETKDEASHVQVRDRSPRVREPKLRRSSEAVIRDIVGGRNKRLARGHVSETEFRISGAPIPSPVWYETTHLDWLARLARRDRKRHREILALLQIEDKRRRFCTDAPSLTENAARKGAPD